jgi:hypothetical protein
MKKVFALVVIFAAAAAGIAVEKAKEVSQATILQKQAAAALIQRVCRPVRGGERQPLVRA